MQVAKRGQGSCGGWAERCRANVWTCPRATWKNCCDQLNRHSPGSYFSSAQLNQKAFSRGCPEERQRPEMRAIECLRRHLGATTQAMQGLHVGAPHSQGGGRRRGPRLHLGTRSKPNETVKLGTGAAAAAPRSAGGQPNVLHSLELNKGARSGGG